MSNFVKTVLLGIGGTAIIDCWTFILKLFGISSQGLLFVGRWLAYLPTGKVFHNTIIQTPSIAYELLIGWVAHYCIGVAFAFLLVFVYGKEWLMKPRLYPALVIALLTLIPPVFIVQPVLGFGVAFSNLPTQSMLLLKITAIHLIYGAGLYWTGKLIHTQMKPSLLFVRNH